MPVLDTAALIENRVAAIARFHQENGLDRAELDVSGGIDSAVVLMLLARALGPNKVTAVYSSIQSSEASLRRARLVAEAADVKLVELDLGPTYEALVAECVRGAEAAGYSRADMEAHMTADFAVKGSLRSCLRAPVGRFMNRLTRGGIRHGTGNEDEDRWLRFYQKGGDGEVDLNFLAMLSKGEVYQLAVALGVPREIIEALPTPDLWGVGEGHNDEEELTKISGVEWTYSRVNPDTGEYVRVGTIERMSRFLDSFVKLDDGYQGTPACWVFSGQHDKVMAQAEKYGLTRKHLESARHWEEITRHKENPNCPSLGDRELLTRQGLLTDDLPGVTA